jgi:hypothetical protein
VQVGIATAVGDALPPVALPTKVSAAWATIPVKGRPVAFVRIPEAGVPRAGVVNTGLVSVTPAKVVVVELAATEVLPITIGNPLLPPPNVQME